MQKVFIQYSHTITENKHTHTLQNAHQYMCVSLHGLKQTKSQPSHRQLASWEFSTPDGGSFTARGPSKRADCSAG